MTCYKQVLLYFILFRTVTPHSNEWSSCSRTCGMGISHRLISCPGHKCTGAEREFRICDMKECPDNYDFRSEQCQKYGEKLKPLTDTSNPCKLMCMLTGQKPVEKATAIDGTPCLSSGICVDGTCVPVGCNGILGSEEKIDECERCGSANGICLRVPCMINHNLTTNEYTTTIPAESTRIKIMWTSACNISVYPDSANHYLMNGSELTAVGPLKETFLFKINCLEGHHTLNCGYHTPLYETARHYDGSDISEKNYQWIVGNGFTTCSQTCGIGVQRSKIYCQDQVTRKITDNSLCNHLSIEHLDIHMRICNMIACPYEWKVTKWSSCSKSCGGGHRSRNVTCKQVINIYSDPVTKDPTLCSENQPQSQEVCNHHHCYNHWHTEPWSDCSSSCGNGTRTRSVTCINAHGVEIEANNCSLLTKPEEKKNCTGEICTYKWIASDWSNCSANCGQGNQTRSVYCQYIKGKRPVNDSLCLQNIKPASTKKCQSSCCTKQWLVERWGPCQAEKCHYEGLKYRNYFCIVNGSKGLYFDHTKCDNLTKPEAVTQCYKTESCRPHWVPLPWGECGRTCDGIRIRGLICKLGDRLVDDAECPRIKPTVVEKCNENVPCPPPPPIIPCVEKPYCESFLPYTSNPAVISLCKQYCCNRCESD